jgi:hypothetical protein
MKRSVRGGAAGGGWPVIFGFWLAAFSSCGTTTPSASKACADMASVRCNKVDSCGANAIAVRFGDLATCQAREIESCTNALAAPGTSATPTSTESCADAYASVSCTDYLNNTLPPVCQPMPGGLAPGQPCAFPSQCQSRFCGIDKNAACGVCAPLPALGGSCAHLTSCGPGLKCVDGGVTCAEETTSTGDPCDKDDPCGAGFSCDGAKASTGVAGTCQPAVTSPGAPCDPKRQTAPGCDANLALACDPISLTCVAVTLAAPGAPCDNSLIVCGSGASCSIPAGATSGTCLSALADGVACDPTSDTACLNPARCVVSGAAATGVCGVLTAVGCH